MNERQAYASDLRDGQFGVIENRVPAPKSGGRPPKYKRREIVNGIMYVLRSGCAWRMMPHDLPTWRITYHYFGEWKLDGTWERIHDKLRGDLRKASGRKRMPSAGIIDSQSVKTTEKGGLVATMHTGAMQEFPVRKHPRLPLPVYQAGPIFFLTCATYARFPWFERFEGLALDSVELLESLADERGTDIFAWCFMPDHVHLLVRDNDTVEFVRRFKGRLTPIARKLERGRSLWQNSFYDHACATEI